MYEWRTNSPLTCTKAAQPGIAVNRFAREIGGILKVIGGALATTECQSVGPLCVSLHSESSARLLKDHAATRRLLREARARDTSRAQHIHDLLVAREAALNGQEYNRLLWVPSEPPAPQDNLVDAPAPEARGASAAAAAWLKRRSSG
jgi:hypothetical protein